MRESISWVSTLKRLMTMTQCLFKFVCNCVYRGPFSTAKFIYNEGGVKYLWRGSGPAVIRLSIGAGMHFFLLDGMKDLFTNFTGTSERTTMQNVVIGGMLVFCGIINSLTMIHCP